MKNILLVDDDEDITTMLEFRIQKMGHNIEIIQKGSEVEPHVHSKMPDLIIMDVNIPPPSGLDLCKTLKGNAATSQIPIILISGKEIEEDVKADAFVLKPYEWKDLEKQIDTFLKQPS